MSLMPDVPVRPGQVTCPRTTPSLLFFTALRWAQLVVICYVVKLAQSVIFFCSTDLEKFGRTHSCFQRVRQCIQTIIQCVHKPNTVYWWLATCASTGSTKDKLNKRCPLLKAFGCVAQNWRWLSTYKMWDTTVVSLTTHNHTLKLASCSDSFFF